MNCKRVLSQRSQFLLDCSPVLLEPCKAALDDPKLGYYLFVAGLESARLVASLCVAPQSLAGGTNLIFFKACSGMLPFSRGSLQIAKYECAACTVRHQQLTPDRQQHRTEHPYKSTGPGLVFLPALFSSA